MRHSAPTRWALVFTGGPKLPRGSAGAAILVISAMLPPFLEAADKGVPTEVIELSATTLRIVDSDRPAAPRTAAEISISAPQQTVHLRPAPAQTATQSEKQVATSPDGRAGESGIAEGLARMIRQADAPPRLSLDLPSEAAETPTPHKTQLTLKPPAGTDARAGTDNVLRAGAPEGGPGRDAGHVRFRSARNEAKTPNGTYPNTAVRLAADVPGPDVPAAPAGGTVLTFKSPPGLTAAMARTIPQTANALRLTDTVHGNGWDLRQAAERPLGGNTLRAGDRGQSGHAVTVATYHDKPAESEPPAFLAAPLLEDAEPVPVNGNRMGPFEVTDHAGQLTVGLRRGKLMSTEMDVCRTAVGDPDVCEVLQLTPHEVLLTGKGSGTTHLTFWFQNGSHPPTTYLVRVAPGPEGPELREAR